MISVLLPFRDAAETLAEAVDSVLTQDHCGPLELIAIDDGSQDRGAAKLPASCVRLSTGGVGIARALEAGREASRGDLVARMDADDISQPSRFAKQVALLQSNPRLAAVGTQVEPFVAPGQDGDVGPGMLRYIAWQNGVLGPAAHARQIFVEAPLCHPSVMLRRAALDEAGGWRAGPFPEDYDLWLRLDALGWQLDKVAEVLFRWRHTPGRATFSDPRYAIERFVETKAPHLARRLAELDRPVTIWGAGPTGKHLLRALERHGVAAAPPATIRVARFVDIDPRKVGRTARGAPIDDVSTLRRGAETVVVAVSSPGARDLVRARLDELGFREGADYLCAA